MANARLSALFFRDQYNYVMRPKWLVNRDLTHTSAALSSASPNDFYRDVSQPLSTNEQRRQPRRLRRTLAKLIPPLLHDLNAEFVNHPCEASSDVASGTLVTTALRRFGNSSKRTTDERWPRLGLLDFREKLGDRRWEKLSDDLISVWKRLICLVDVFMPRRGTSLVAVLTSAVTRQNSKWPLRTATLTNRIFSRRSVFWWNSNATITHRNRNMVCPESSR